MRLTGVRSAFPSDNSRKQPVFGLGPEFRDVGQVLVTDDDKQIEVGEVAPDRIFDPVAARIAPEQDDLEDLAVAEALHRTARDRLGKPFANDLDHVRQFALFCFG